MAKSLRSKSKLRAKSIKRGKEFQKAVDERQLRLLEKAKENLVNQKIAEAKAKNNAEGDEIIVDENEKEKAQPTDLKNVSTSGQRNARHHVYKMNKKKNHTKFAKKK